MTYFLTQTILHLKISKKKGRKVHKHTTPPTPSDSEIDRYVNPSKVAKSDKGRKHTGKSSKVPKITMESYKRSAPSEVAKSDKGHSRGHPTPKRPTGDTGSHVSRSHSTRHPSKVAEVEQAATLDTKMMEVMSRLSQSQQARLYSQLVEKTQASAIKEPKGPVKFSKDSYRRPKAIVSKPPIPIKVERERRETHQESRRHSKEERKCPKTKVKDKRSSEERNKRHYERKDYYHDYSSSVVTYRGTSNSSVYSIEDYKTDSHPLERRSRSHHADLSHSIRRDSTHERRHRSASTRHVHPRSPSRFHRNTTATPDSSRSGYAISSASRSHYSTLSDEYDIVREERDKLQEQVAHLRASTVLQSSLFTNVQKEKEQLEKMLQEAKKISKDFQDSCKEGTFSTSQGARP